MNKCNGFICTFIICCVNESFSFNLYITLKAHLYILVKIYLLGFFSNKPKLKWSLTRYRLKKLPLSITRVNVSTLQLKVQSSHNELRLR